MSPLGRPPADFSGFPRHRLKTSHALFEIHLLGQSPWWFSSSGAARFDLRPPRGTCYFAEDPLGSFVEAFRDIGTVDQADVDARRLSRLSVPTSAVVADCATPRARSFGVTAAIHSTEDYTKTQQWASAFAAAGFAGIRYLVSHDPSQRLVGVALFGNAGERGWPYREELIPPELILAARMRFGIVVLPAPGRRS